MGLVTTADILKEAAIMIRRGGLSQGARARTRDGFEIGVYVKSPAKRYCLQGAVLMAYENARKRGRVMLDDGRDWQSVVEDELARRGLPRDMAEFNDTPGRTTKDVAELLEAATQRN